jgi:hypothetical protein
MPQLSKVGQAWDADTVRGIVLRNLPSLQASQIHQQAFAAQIGLEYLYVLLHAHALTWTRGLLLTSARHRQLATGLNFNCAAIATYPLSNNAKCVDVCQMLPACLKDLSAKAFHFFARSDHHCSCRASLRPDGLNGRRVPAA